MKPIETYKLPMGIAFALRTNRPDLIAHDGKPHSPIYKFTPEEQSEIVRLLVDLINDREDTARKIEEMRQVVEMTMQTSEGLMHKLRSTVEDLVKTT